MSSSIGRSKSLSAKVWLWTGVGALLLAGESPRAQAPQAQTPLPSTQVRLPQDTDGRCLPVAQRAGRPYGCFILASNPVGTLDAADAVWHLETFPTINAATRAKTARGLVIEAFDKVWLLTVARTGFRSPGATHVAEIGPIPVQAGTAYTAQFMEATFKPGMKSRVHRHAGAEAWYTLSGSACLETPDGMTVSQPGGPPVIVPSGPPMELTATGSEIRHSLVLILHDASQPHTSPASDWTPKGLCMG
jgi:quercetin dioxygenase-like cupin family protein